MGDPAGEKKEGGSSGKIGWLLRQRIDVKQVSCMVQRHDHHDQATGNVNRWNAFHKRLVVTQDKVLVYLR